MDISLSIWSVDVLHLFDEVRRLDPFIDSFHVDVMDGHFVDELLFGVYK